MRLDNIARRGKAAARGALVAAALGLALLPTLAAPAAAEPPPLEVYGHLPGFEDAAISASGRFMAMLATIEGKRRLVVTDPERNLISSFAFGPNDKIRSIRWAGDQAVLIHYSVTSRLPMGFTTDKAELGSVLVIPLDKSPPWGIFAKSRDVTGGVWGSYGLTERDGKWFGYFGGVTLNRDNGMSEGTLPSGALRPDLYEVDLQTQKIRRLAERASGELSDRDWLVDGTGAIGATLDWFHDSGRWTLYSGKRTPLASGKVGGGAWLVGFTPDGSGVVYALKDAVNASARWLAVPLAGGTPVPFLEDADVGSVEHDHARRLTGYRLGSAGGGTHYFDPARDKTYRKIEAAFRNKRIAIQSASTDFDHLLVSVDGLDDPGTWYRVDVSERRAEAFGFAYAIDHADVGSSRFFAYAAADGTKMEGVLTQPPDARRRICRR